MLSAKKKTTISKSEESSKPNNQDSTSKQKVKKVSLKPKVSRTQRAGITFPVSRVDKLLRERGLAKRVTSEAPVYMAAVLEYLVFEVLELSMNIGHQNKKTRITPQHINWAIHNDLELNELFKDVTIASGGVFPQSVQYPASRSKMKSSGKPKSSKNSNDDDPDQDNVNGENLSQLF